MHQKIWLYLVCIICSFSLQSRDTSNKKQRKSFKFQKEWISKRDQKKVKKALTQDDNRYELQLSPSHTVKNSTFQLREKVDIDQATIHPGRTETKAAAHFDAEGA